jgi:flavin reductase (DIM6/NTAB) family NADH-FMN oxidoreductase RutF
LTPLVTRAKRLLLKLANYPRYGPVGLDDPQEMVDVWLHGAGEPRNVTRNNVIAALRPFTIAVMLDRNDPQPCADQPFRLCMYDRQTPRLMLGVIHLRLARTIDLPDHRFRLFEVDGCENLCVPDVSLRLYYLEERRRAEQRRRKNPYNFQMTPADLRASHVFYICPRPVVLVSVEHEGSGNLFPMDLIGPTDSPWFSMTLRSTSPAVRLMQQSRRMALASIPFAYQGIAYELGKHHKLANIDWAGLPFATERSLLFDLRVPDAALRVREVSVREFHEVGSHVLFITSVESESISRGARSPQLFHIFGSYRQYLSEFSEREAQL